MFTWGRANLVDAGIVWDDLDAEARSDLGQDAMAAVGHPLPGELIGALAVEDGGFSVATELAVAGTLISFSGNSLIGTIEPTRLGAPVAINVRDITTQGESRLPDTSSVLNMGDARAQLQLALTERLELSESAEATLSELVAGLLSANLTYSSNATRQRRREATNAVEPVFYELKRGRVLLRQGDEVTAQKILELEALRQQYRSDRSLRSLAGMVLLMALAVFSLWRYVTHYQRRVRYQRVQRLYPLVLVVLVGMVALVRGSLFLGEAIANAAPREPFTSVASYEYAVPFASGGILLMLLVNVQVAWAFSAVFGVVVGAMTQDFEMTVFALLSSFAALYGISQYKQRTALTRAGMIVGGVNVMAALGLGLLAIEPLGALAFQSLCALAGGILFSIVVTIAIPPLEHIFQSLTDIKLLELSNMNLPLLKDLAVSAPGTYHHSVVVGTLAETAAEAIGVNPLFARVSAYYHDIGKLRQPQYFVENQKEGNNPHDDLSPNMSALILVSHVKDGIAYAQEHGLPQPLIDAIPQHHGTRLIRFFYEKAKQAAIEDGREVDESDFRYPGPKPRSKETAILMLADGVEAISRTLSDTSPAKLRAMIRRAIQEVVDDDQLAECALTLEDLSKISDAFLSVLAGMHHQRIEYPESTETSRPNLRATLQDEDSGSQFSDQTYH
ncbi:MAG: HDIG domain-containing protein [Acidobacteria bacterium]|nr:HDIG domain-containing protein [Acidobacteriota bacterium]